MVECVADGRGRSDALNFLTTGAIDGVEVKGKADADCPSVGSVVEGIVDMIAAAIRNGAN